MLTQVFRSILGTSLSVLPVVAALLLLRPLLRGRYAPRLRHLLWLAVAVRLMLPVSVPGLARLLLPAGDAVYILDNDSAAVLRAFAEAEAAFGSPTGAAATQAGTKALPLMTVLAAVWLAGAAAFLLCQLAAGLVTARRQRRWSRPVTDAATLAAFRELKLELGIHRRIGLWKCEAATVPMLMGLFSPRVILPGVDDGDSGHLREVLRHELTHYRRGDLWYKLVLLLACALHWFNPAVHVLARCAELDMELACDQDVLSGADRAARRSYGHAVLSYAGAGRGTRAPVATCFQNGRRQVKQRILEIMDSGRKRRGVVPMVTVVAAILLSAVLISCAEKPVDTPVQVPTEVPEISVAGSGDPEQTEVQHTAEEIPGLEDPEYNQLRQEMAKAEVDGVSEQIQYSKNEYPGGDMLWPAPGMYAISSIYGPRFGGSDFHTGIDIRSAEEDDSDGRDVVAAQAGTVAFINNTYTSGVGYGIYLILDHGGEISTLYAHLSAVEVTLGDEVQKGQVIGKTGSTGWADEPHLHFEVRKDGKHEDPRPYLTAGEDFADADTDTE